MKTFREYILTEVDAAPPPTGAPPGGDPGLGGLGVPGTPPGGPGAIPGGLGGPSLGGLGGPGLGGLGGPGGMPGMPGAPPGGMPMGAMPPPKQIKPLDVWDILEKILGNKPIEDEKEEKTGSASPQMVQNPPAQPNQQQMLMGVPGM